MPEWPDESIWPSESIWPDDTTDPKEIKQDVTVEIPHFQFPFRFTGNGHAAEVEQGSPEDYESQVLALLRTPLGARTELPEFGVPEQALNQNGANLAQIQAALSTWIPEAEFDVHSDKNELYKLIDRVQVARGPQDA